MKMQPSVPFMDRDYVNASYARIVDGRLTYFWLLLVEPIMARQHDRNLTRLRSCGGELAHISSLIVEAGIPANRAIARILLSNGHRGRIGAAVVRALLDNGDREPFRDARAAWHAPEQVVLHDEQIDDEVIGTSVRKIATARVQLARIGLRYFLDLAVGAFWIADTRYGDGTMGCDDLELITMSLEESDVGAIAQILRQSARSWLNIMIQCEDEGAIPSIPGEEILDIFSSCVVIEGLRRLVDDPAVSPAEREEFKRVKEELSEGLPQPASFSQIMKDFVDRLPLCGELIACYYPLWRRYSFLFDAPFDHAKRLPFDAGERAEGAAALRWRVERALTGRHHP